MREMLKSNTYSVLDDSSRCCTQGFPSCKLSIHKSCLMLEDYASYTLVYVSISNRQSLHFLFQIMELENHPFFVAVQYHPEYISRPMKPSPPYLGLILAATSKLNSFLANMQDKQVAVADDSSDDEDFVNIVKSLRVGEKKSTEEATPIKLSPSSTSIASSEDS